VTAAEFAGGLFDSGTILAAEILDGGEIFIAREIRAEWCDDVWRCGYVAFPGEPMPGAGSAEYIGGAPVNGGVTCDRGHSEHRVLGWDYNHYCNRGAEKCPSVDTLRDEAHALVVWVRSGEWREGVRRDEIDDAEVSL